MNAKTWQTIGGFAVPMFLVIMAALIFPFPLLRLAGFLCLVAVTLLCLTGAWFGILLCRGRLHLGCPFCDARSQVTHGTKKQLFLECPSCGSVCVTCRPFRMATASRQEIESE
jgi:hypothetical protein